MPDFWCGALKLAVEVDGSIHETQREYDEWRDGILRTKGVLILRFQNSAALALRDRCVEEIKAAITERLANKRRKPAPSASS